MKDWKTFLTKLLYPPIWLVILLTILCGALIPVILVKGWGEHPLAVIAYVPAAYTVTVLTVACVKVFPGSFRKLKEKLYEHPFGNRFMTDVRFKTNVKLHISFVINLLYVAMNLFFGLWHKTVWFTILAGYYIILSVMRFLLLRYVHSKAIGKHILEEHKRARLCAIILMTINLALSGAVLMIMYQDKGFEYQGILIYIMAMYTFYITITAIRNMISYKKYQSPVMSMAKIIDMAAALVSMLSLETAMLAQFGSEMTELSRKIMVGATGAGVSVVVVTMSIYSIVKANKYVNKEKRNERN